jgi:hypothetical protein
MFMYLHPIYDNIVSVGHRTFVQQDFTAGQYTYVYRENIIAGVSGFILSTVFLFAPLLFLLRRWRLPAGAAVVVLGSSRCWCRRSPISGTSVWPSSA